MAASDLDDLFALPPEQFTAARDDLAKRLRSTGNGKQARTVAAVRRPTLPAWALNQLARRHPDAMAELAEAGRAARAAQRRALSGARDSGVRQAQRERRRMVDALTAKAVGILDGAGFRADPHRPEIAASLQAASVDEEAAVALCAGRLSRPLPAPTEIADVGALIAVPGYVAAEDDPAETGAEAIADEAAADEAAAAEAAAQARVRDARRRAQDADAHVEAAQRRAEMAEGEAETQREQAQRLRSQAEEAQRMAERAASRAQKSREEAEKARAEAASRARELREAEQTAAGMQR